MSTDEGGPDGVFAFEDAARVLKKVRCGTMPLEKNRQFPGWLSVSVTVCRPPGMAWSNDQIAKPRDPNMMQA
jgi:hypothetical protein